MKFVEGSNVYVRGFSFAGRPTSVKQSGKVLKINGRMADVLMADSNKVFTIAVQRLSLKIK